MARGDPTYFQVDIDIFPNGERFSALSASEAFMYIAVWGLAVKCRSDTIPKDISTDKWMAEWAHKCPKSVHRWMDKLSQVCLVTRNSDGTLTVHNVKSRHKKLRWDKCPQMIKTGTSRTPSQGGRVRDLESMRDIKTDPDTELVTQRRDELATPGAVDVKKLLEDQDRKRSGEKSTEPKDNEPWNQVEQESELEREVHLWFLDLWPHGQYDWEAEKDSLLSQVRKNGQGAYNVARGMLKEDRRSGKRIHNELAFLNGIAREQAKKVSTK